MDAAMNPDMPERSLASIPLIDTRTLTPEIQQELFGEHEDIVRLLVANDIVTRCKRPVSIRPEMWVACHLGVIFEECRWAWTVLIDICTCKETDCGSGLKTVWQLLSQSYSTIRDAIPNTERHYFNANFMEQTQSVFCNLVQVYVHVYFHHYEQFSEINMEGELNAVFKRFMFFGILNKIITQEDLSPLANIVDGFVAEEQRRGTWPAVEPVE